MNTECAVPAVDLWRSRTDRPADYYRIPALTVTQDGTLLAVCDLRYGNNSDLGNGHRIDLVMKRSADNGATWTAEKQLTHTPSDADTGYGDAAIIADRETDEVLLLCVQGNISYQAGTRDNHQHIIQLRSYNGGRTFSSPQDISGAVFRHNSAWESLFFASGRIMQSRFIKIGDRYRIYAALLCKNYGNAVLYSDDFGAGWNVLGDPAMPPAPAGDEAKIEELPDGSVLLSSRKDCGRYFTVFTYTDPVSARGSWAAAETCAFGSCRGTNGEVLVVKARKTGNRQPVYLLLQSLPAAEPRSNISIYWRELDKRPLKPEELCTISCWNTGGQEPDGKPYLVEEAFGAYSTMIAQKDGSIGFLYESHTRGCAPDGEKLEYDIRYKRLSLREITGGQYESIFCGIGSVGCPYTGLDGQSAPAAEIAYFAAEGLYWA